MELFFLALLLVLLILALSSGFPVAFALPGSAILTIAIAAAFGYVVEGDIDAYFAQGGAGEWLSAGVTNFRSLYWDVERDTLIAIPLFVFMGIMLQRSRIAEDLLVTMAQLFGPVPGGLGISVVFVGALLAATTGIVGATVIAMGLISLPAMLRNNYSKPLAAGTICASGTLGQIIPPSIVLIILADQLSSAADQASTARKAAFKNATGEFTMPSQFDVVSASAGDMFMGAFIPGMVLVLLYMLYILVYAQLKPSVAPPVPNEHGLDRRFALRVLLALLPPLTLIFTVLGSIIMGIATVNQAGAIGAIGAMIMGGYRLTSGTRMAYVPAIIAVVSLIGILFVVNSYELNVKNIKDGDVPGLIIASVSVAGLLLAILWSAWRAYVVDDTLKGVMLETAKTTSMVFIILIGAAMLTSAFRAFGGEELVRDYLTALPGGFWTQFIVVMAVIFFLGFFLDFIEIAVVVVPIVAPILLADPAANITAVWLGVMVGLNIQTSFLTPPFGFALFYLRGVAPPEVKTTQIYRGAAVFIALQLAGLAIVGAYPSLVNTLPNRVFLTSVNAPPPMNPKLQYCLEEYVFGIYDSDRDFLSAAIERARGYDISFLPEAPRKALAKSFDEAGATFDHVEKARAAGAALAEFAPEYRVIQTKVRTTQAEVRKARLELIELAQQRTNLERSDVPPADRIAEISETMKRVKEETDALEASIPDGWEVAHKRYEELAGAENKARLAYRRNVDGAYEAIGDLREVIAATDALRQFEPTFATLRDAVSSSSAEDAMQAIKEAERVLGDVAGSSDIKSRLSKARRALKGKAPKPDEAMEFLEQAEEQYREDLKWRDQAQPLGQELATYDEAIRGSIGLRKQDRLESKQAKVIASCQSVHRDISLAF